MSLPVHNSPFTTHDMSTDADHLHNTAGITLPAGVCVVIVRTEWNAATINKLEIGCLRVLNVHQVHHKIITVPGAFEITFAIKKYWEQHKYKEDKPHAFVALGCVLRGDTPHFEYVCQAVTAGVTQLNLTIPVPTIFGVLTVDNQQQIEERTGDAYNNKGAEAAITALKMIALVNSFK